MISLGQEFATIDFARTSNFANETPLAIYPKLERHGKIWAYKYRPDTEFLVFDQKPLAPKAARPLRTDQVNDTSFFLKHSMEPWATVLFRVLWLVLFMFLVWTGFTLYKLWCACLELYRLGYIIDFVPGAVLIVIATIFGLWALAMLAKVAFWRLELFEISRRDGMSAR